MKALRFSVLAICAVLLMGGMAFAGFQDDSVSSQHIVEADGTSGQDTNSGNGIKTGHIQDAAIISAKIADGAVTSAKIANSSVDTAEIADGAITDSKITGPISSSKISSTGLDADTLDGSHASAFAAATHTHAGEDITSGTISIEKLATFQNVLVVHKGSADDVHTFNTIGAALANITDASASNPYIVYVMPGVYTREYPPKTM